MGEQCIEADFGIQLLLPLQRARLSIITQND